MAKNKNRNLNMAGQLAVAYSYGL